MSSECGSLFKQVFALSRSTSMNLQAAVAWPSNMCIIRPMSIAHLETSAFISASRVVKGICGFHSFKSTFRSNMHQSFRCSYWCQCAIEVKEECRGITITCFTCFCIKTAPQASTGTLSSVCSSRKYSTTLDRMSSLVFLLHSPPLGFLLYFLLGLFLHYKLHDWSIESFEYYWSIGKQ